MGSSKSNFDNKVCNYNNENGHIEKDCYKLQNREKLATIKNWQQLEISGEVDVVENHYNDGEIFVIFDETPNRPRIEFLI